MKSCPVMAMRNNSRISPLTLSFLLVTCRLALIALCLLACLRLLETLRWSRLYMTKLVEEAGVLGLLLCHPLKKFKKRRENQPESAAAGGASRPSQLRRIQQYVFMLRYVKIGFQIPIEVVDIR